MVFFDNAKSHYACRMRDVTLRQLRFLRETVDTGSIAGAAARLHLTAPAIAQQLRMLERGVGLPLLERGPGGQRPTEAARILLGACLRVDAELAACDEALQSLRAARTGRVTLGAVSTAKYFAPHILAAFHEANPEVTVALTIGNRDRILHQLENYEIDFAIMGRPPGSLEVVQQVFGEHRYVVIARPSHPLVGRAGVPIARVAEETMLVREPGSGTRLHLDALFSAAELQPTVGMEITSNETIKQAVIAGLGVALISAHTIAAEVHDGRLAVLDVQGLPILRHWLVVRLARRSVSPAMTSLWDFVLREATSRLPVLDPATPG
jgi:DNA-binding transcriptional LysR family regulator